MGANLQRPDGILITGSPWAQYERVTVTFPATPNTDLVIRYHQLTPIDPTVVEYYTLKKSAAGNIYNDYSASRKPWKPGFIILRSDVASLQATLLLTAPRIET